MDNCTDQLWIDVPSWDRFQHYSDRQPPWIKLYLELLDKPEWLTLTPTAKSLLVTIWLLRARLKGPVEVVILRLYTPIESRTRHFTVALKQLNGAGFIALSASAVLAPEKRREEARAPAPTRVRAGAREGAVKTGNDGGRVWSPGMPPLDTEAEVRRLIHNHVLTEPFELDAYDLAEPVRSELRGLLP